MYVAIQNAMFHIECRLTPYPRLRLCDPLSLGEWFATFRRHYSGSRRFVGTTVVRDVS